MAKDEIYSAGGASSLRENALALLAKAKKVEAGQANLTRVNVLHGYVMTNDPAKWKHLECSGTVDEERNNFVPLSKDKRIADSLEKNKYKI